MPYRLYNALGPGDAKRTRREFEDKARTATNNLITPPVFLGPIPVLPRENLNFPDTPETVPRETGVLRLPDTPSTVPINSGTLHLPKTPSGAPNNSRIGAAPPIEKADQVIPAGA